MGEMTVKPDDRQASESRTRVLVVVGAILGLFVIAAGTVILANRDAHINLLAFLFELIGNPQAGLWYPPTWLAWRWWSPSATHRALRRRRARR